MTAPRHLRVFLSSPGDVAAERAAAVAVLLRLPYDPLLRGRVTVEIVAWDAPNQPLTMLATRTPQAEVDARLPRPSQCDLVVGILWRRLGTPLPSSYAATAGSPVPTGTAWELADALDAEPVPPPVLIYRRRLADAERMDADPVERFLDRLRDPDGSIRGGLNLYDEPADFEPMFEVHARDLVQRLLGTSGRVPARAEPRRLDAQAPAGVAAGGWLRVRAQVCLPASPGLLAPQIGSSAAVDDLPSSVLPVLFDADPADGAAVSAAVALRCTARGAVSASDEQPMRLLPGIDSGVVEFALATQASGAALLHVALRQRVAGDEWLTAGMVALSCDVLPAAPVVPAEGVARRLLGCAGDLRTGAASAADARMLARLVALQLTSLADLLTVASEENSGTAYSPAGVRADGLALWRRWRLALASALRDDDALFEHLHAHPALAPAAVAALVMARIEPLVPSGTARVLAAMVVRADLHVFTGRAAAPAVAHA